MRTAICTISTQSHVFKSKALLESVLALYQTEVYCLVIDSISIENHEVIHFDSLNDIKSIESIQLQKKYKGDKLRWALKSIYLKHLLEKGFDHVIYCDNDIFFYSSPEFLFEKLTKSNFLLTPHYYNSNPEKNQNWLEANFRVGMYNAGFIGVSQKGIEILDWWTTCCLYNIKKSFWRGLFDDQKYLDLVPVLFDSVEIIKNKGCNLAGWNAANYTFERNEKNQLLINGDKLVFIHFTTLSFTEFCKEESPLHTEFQHYEKELKKQKMDYKFSPSQRTKREWKAFAYFIRWKLTRLFEK